MRCRYPPPRRRRRFGRQIQMLSAPFLAPALTRLEKVMQIAKNPQCFFQVDEFGEMIFLLWTSPFEIEFHFYCMHAVQVQTVCYI